MKTFACGLAIALICISGAVQAASVNLVNNGDFTDGLTGWVNYGGTPDTSSPDGHNVKGVGFYQDLTWDTMTAGDEYELSFMAGSLDQSATGVVLVRNWPDAGNPSSHWFEVSAEELNTGWATYSTIWTMPSNCDGKFPEISFDYAGATGNLVLDNVSFGHYVQTPEPGTMGLVVIGAFSLLAYAWRKRR